MLDGANSPDPHLINLLYHPVHFVKDFVVELAVAAQWAFALTVRSILRR